MLLGCFLPRHAWASPWARRLGRRAFSAGEDAAKAPAKEISEGLSFFFLEAQHVRSALIALSPSAFCRCACPLRPGAPVSALPAAAPRSRRCAGAACALPLGENGPALPLRREGAFCNASVAFFFVSLPSTRPPCSLCVYVCVRVFYPWRCGAQAPAAMLCLPLRCARRRLAPFFFFLPHMTRRVLDLSKTCACAPLLPSFAS